MKYTTLNEIRKHEPCKTGWYELLHSLGKTMPYNELLSFKCLLDTLGLDDAIWCLRVMPYRDECLFRADVAELVLPIFEKKFHDDGRPRKAIEAARNYAKGSINNSELNAAARAASRAAASDSGVYFAARAASAAACVENDASDTYEYTAASDDVIEKLFIKHFCGEEA